MKNMKHVLSILSLVVLTACGGGSGGDNIPPTATVIKGVASKGLINKGTVNVFALNENGSKGALLGSGSTDDSGAYNISIGSYTGSVLVEAYGGYTDEATGMPAFVPASAPLRAALANAVGTVSLSVTPLTDLAVREAGTLTKENITIANTVVSNIFKIDVTTTAPAAPTAAAFNADTTTQAQKDYALALAAVSQLMQTGDNDLATTLTNLSSGIGQAGMTMQTIATFTAAAKGFIQDNPNNLTGVASIAGTSLQTIGSTAMLSVVLQGSGAVSVKGVQGIITLPSGVTMQADTTGKVTNGISTPASGTLDCKYSAVSNGTPASVTFGYISSGNLTAGDLIILTVNISPGTSVPAVNAFAISSSKLVDADGVVVSSASLALR